MPKGPPIERCNNQMKLTLKYPRKFPNPSWDENQTKNPSKEKINLNGEMVTKH
jgi:hypothetical protein